MHGRLLQSCDIVKARSCNAQLLTAKQIVYWLLLQVWDLPGRRRKRAFM